MGLARTRSPLEEGLGMLYYSADKKGVGGILRQIPEDFVVEEITREGALANFDLASLRRGNGRYTLAVLEKTSRDLLPVLSELKRRFGADVGFAGIKDRRAVTSQLISISGSITEEDLSAPLKNIRIKMVGRSRWPVSPGELRGNRFTITIRSIANADPADLEFEGWLPGYFGHQRFGTVRPNTHKVGRLILHRDYEGAVREFLAEPYRDEPERIHRTRSELKDGWDLEAALRGFPTSLIFERNVIKKLISQPRDFQGALKALPRNLLRLFINSYQAFLFNFALSERWSSSGLTEASPGDYVAPLDRWGSPSRPIKCNGSNTEKLRRMISAQKAVLMVRVVGNMTELEGTDREIYGRILEGEGASLNDFDGVLGMPFLGTLRFATFHPLSYEILKRGPDELAPGRSKAVMKASLPKACYATVLLRELMRPADPFTAGF
jgi:tRNA pseudouridine13 synthase